MDKSLFKYSEKIEESGIPFYNYLEEVLDRDLFGRILEISRLSNIYIFSGVIRDYFIQSKGIRDIDVVVDSDIVNEIPQIFSDSNIRKNSYGGYKIDFKGIYVDLWHLEDTWTLKAVPVLFEFVEYMPKTAFFNFSSIVYDFNKKQFYYTVDFLKFLKNKRLDYVNELNPNHELCIVNTFYYSERFNLKIAKRLKELIAKWDARTRKDYKDVQLKHFGKVLYSDRELETRLEHLNRI